MSTAFTSADILLPKNAQYEKWAVVACDQYTGEPDYWKETDSIVGDAPSTLRLILPEVYLEQSGVEKRIEDIHAAMSEYLSGGVFEEHKDALIYIERMQDDGKVRAGIVGAIDLEQYDYRKGSTSQVRATEATVVERIPPRVKIRNGAQIELAHIMILIDDDKRTVIEPLAEKTGAMKKVYDFPLMQKGGSIKGWLLGEEEKAAVLAALDAKKDALSDGNTLLYAMGDGNHSLATAKEYYEQLKRDNPGKDMSNHPARYALAEIVNLHSPALEFEAIHRIVMGVGEDELMAYLTERLSLSETGNDTQQRFVSVNNGDEKVWYVGGELSKLTVGSLQSALDEYAKEHDCKIDYIHGENVVKELAQKEGSIGFILPDMLKSELFPTVICDGALPRKTFSMGHAWDKRYYIEARRITE